MRLFLIMSLLASPLLFAEYTSQGYEYPTLSGTDDAIQQNVTLALSQNSLLQGDNIQVAVENGNVTLSGSVKSNSEKSIATTVANSVSGVTNVQNNLIISR